MKGYVTTLNCSGDLSTVPAIQISTKGDNCMARRTGLQYIEGVCNQYIQGVCIHVAMMIFDMRDYFAHILNHPRILRQ